MPPWFYIESQNAIFENDNFTFNLTYDPKHVRRNNSNDNDG